MVHDIPAPIRMVHDILIPIGIVYNIPVPIGIVYTSTDRMVYNILTLIGWYIVS